MRKIMLVIVVGILLLGIPVHGEKSVGMKATVIIQFGNGESVYSTVTLPKDNTTALKATELACENLSIYFHYQWRSYGALVDQIGWEKNDWNTTGYYWHLLKWRNDSYEWETANVGASSLHLRDGDVVAWSYTVDNPSWKPYNMAGAIPGHYGVWNTPRGNTNNTGVYDGNPAGDTPIWKFKSNSQWGFSSTPVVSHGIIFIADSSSLYAINMHGSLLWNNTLGASGYYGLASPVVFGNYVLVGTSDKCVRAFYINNGTLAWGTYIGEDIVSSPVIHIHNRVPILYITTFNLNSTGHLYAIYLTNGTIEWEVSLMGSTYMGIPAIYKDELIIPIAGIENNSYSWNPPYGIQCVDMDGNYIWNFTTDASVRSSPVLNNDRIYFVTADGSLLSLGINGTQIWKSAVGSSTSTPAVRNGVIYVGNNNGYIYSVRDNGTEANFLWSLKLNGAIQSGILLTENGIITTTNSPNGSAYFISLDGKVVWKYTPNPHNYILSSPVPADSYILIASNNGYLYALGKLPEPNIPAPVISGAYVGKYVRVEIPSLSAYQVLLYYRNVAGDIYHGVWMNYSKGKYVGYIPPQKSIGTIHYYIAVVFSNGYMESTELGEIEIKNAPEKLLKIVFLSDTNVTADVNLSYSVKVVDETNTPVDGAFVSIYVDNISFVSGYTRNGFFSFNLTLSEGVHTLHIVATKNGYKDAELWEKINATKESGNKKESSGNPYLLPVIIVVAVLAFLSIGIAYILKKKSKKYSELTREEVKNQK